jgi:hypothetical protein
VQRDDLPREGQERGESSRDNGGVTTVRSLALAVPLFLVVAQGAAAQEGFRVEVVPSVGYRTGATLNESASGAEYDVEPSASWGALADVSLGSPGLFVEVAWTRQESRVPYANAFGKGLNEVSFDSFLVGGHWDAAPRATVRPFLGALVGVTRIEAPGSAVTRFTAALSGGVKLMASRSFGARLEARALGVFSGGSAGGLCGPQGCTVGLSGWGTLQADLSAGVLVAF